MRSRCPSALAMLCCFVLLLNDGTNQRLSAEEPTSTAVGAWVREQIKDGRLTVEFYDPAKPPKPFPGWTDFEFRLEYRYDCKLEFPASKNKTNKTKGTRSGLAVIIPTYTKIEVPIKHRMQLPKYLESERWYEKGLAKHELEHVRVGLHPRLEMLGKHLVGKLRRVEGMIDKPTDANREWIATRLNAEIAPRRDAIQALVLEINRKIDTVTNHGVLPYPDLDEFLTDLYLKENLDEMKFPYLPEVLDLINTKEYQRARLVIPDVEPAAQKPETK